MTEQVYRADEQIMKIKDLKDAYEQLVSHLDQRMELSIAATNDSAQIQWIINTWKHIHNLMLDDYFKWMGEIVKGER